MSSFLDLMGDKGHVHFEKCGDVVVSPKDNMVAMFCHFCRDIFTHLPEFMRHLQWAHSDVLQFTKEQNVYSVEELLSMESSEDDTQSQANSCSSADSGLAGEMEDAGAGPTSSECLANNVDIMIALAAFDVDVDGLNTNHERIADCQTKEIGKTERNIPAEPIIIETPVKETYLKVNYTENEIAAHSSKGFHRVRKPESVEKPKSICDLKSYNINRNRKREAIKQRLSNVKKRIMLSLENDGPKSVLTNATARLPHIKNATVKQELPSFKKESKDSFLAIGYQGIAVPKKLSLDKLESKENRTILTQVKPKIKPNTSSTTSLIKPSLKASPSVRPRRVLSALTNANSNTNVKTSLIKPSIPASLRKTLAKNAPQSCGSPRLNKPQSKVNKLSSHSHSPIISSSPKQSKMSAVLNGSSAKELPAPLGAPKVSNCNLAPPAKKLYVSSTSIKAINKPRLSSPAVKTDPSNWQSSVGRRSTPVKIEQVQILPPINIKQNREMSAKGKQIRESLIRSSVASQQSSEINATKSDKTDPPKRQVRRASLTVVPSSPLQGKKPTRRSSMTTAKPTVNTQPQSSRVLRSGPDQILQSKVKSKKKRSNDSLIESTSSTSTEKGNAKRVKIEQERCSMNLKLSTSAIEFLKMDLKTSKLDADSPLPLAEPCETDALENRIVEDQDKKATKEESPLKKQLSTPQTVAKPEIEALGEDLQLLETVGLVIIKVPSFEDKLPLDQLENFRKIAAKFSKIYQTYDTIWSYRKTKTIGAPHRLVQELNSFTEEVNKEIGRHLTTNEMKRILNLINSWYAEQIDQRFFRKAILSNSVEHYMLLFHFLPKIIPSVYFCEYCEETFPNEPRYKKHVQSLHAVHAFTCAECGKSFKRLYFYEKHLKTVHLKP